ncbi:MAG TPA: response regulator [Opitutaceae bacterium]|nr:response regulator [Opitutaceae bacterium]
MHTLEDTPSMTDGQEGSREKPVRHGAAPLARVLVIDDEENIRTMVQQMLRRAGYDAIAAADGSEGIRLQRERPADLVITDLIMPGQEGLETIMEIRRSFPKTKIIAISGGGHAGVLDFLPIATQLGALRTLPKPFTHQQLLALVKEVIAL